MSVFKPYPTEHETHLAAAEPVDALQDHEGGFTKYHSVPSATKRAVAKLQLEKLEKLNPFPDDPHRAGRMSKDQLVSAGYDLTEYPKDPEPVVPPEVMYPELTEEVHEGGAD